MQARTSSSLARLGDYELVRRIASGGMAEVYEARRPGPRGFAKRVALKRILPHLRKDDRLMRMFCAEARVHAAFQHPNLVSVLDFGESDGELYLVLEYVDGVSLAEVLSAVAARRRAIELGAALHIAREVVNGLAYAHEFSDDEGVSLGVVHRDVAPNNILLGRAGEVKLADFGIVHSSWSEVRTAPGELRGKVGYMSPEQSQGRPVEPRSDLFCVGVVLAEMLLGAPLIPGSTQLEILKNLHAREWENLTGLVPSVPPEVLALLRRLLAKSPQDRPASAARVAHELDQLASARGARMSPHALRLWLADLGVVRIDSNVRVSPDSDHAPRAPDAPAPRAEQATLVDDELTPALTQKVEDLIPISPAPQGPSLRYRLRRPGGEVVGPLSLPSLLGLIATARAGLDSDLAREGGPFLKLSRAFELTRLASRPLYRFFEPIAVLAGERHPVERASLASHLLRLATLKKTGLLVHRHGSEQRRIYFEEGVPAATASTEPRELLGALLAQRGIVSDADVERVLESGYRSGCQIGESLVRANLISTNQLSWSIEEQRGMRLRGLCRAQGGELFFVEGARSGESVMGLPSRPLSPLIEALRAAYPLGEMLQLLAGMQELSFAPSSACAALRGRLCLTTDEAYAFDLCLRGVKLALVLREAQARGSEALRAGAFAAFVGLSAGAFVGRRER